MPIASAEGEYKIYFPKRENYRFICNTTAVQGLRQLPPSADFLILTKSLKDVMVLRSVGIFSVAWQGESVLPDAETIDELKSRFPLIYSLYDFDPAGIKTANKIKRIYGIRPPDANQWSLSVSRTTRGKDPAAMVKKWGTGAHAELGSRVQTAHLCRGIPEDARSCFSHTWTY